MNATHLDRTFEHTTLGSTGQQVGRLGVSASYGVPAKAVERAFDAGVNYFYWGSMRRAQFAQAIRNLSAQRDRLVLVIQSYSRIAGLMSWSLERALRELRLDRADVLLLGLWGKPVPERILNAARRLKERGLVRFVAISSHNRPLIGRWVSSGEFDVIHFRYNAIHNGAESDIFPRLPRQNGPGMVCYTATSWKQLMDPKRVPKGEKVPTAGDCYRFVLTRPEIDVCITGPANAAQMDHAVEALRKGPMSDDELAWMRKGGPSHLWQGAVRDCGIGIPACAICGAGVTDPRSILGFCLPPPTRYSCASFHSSYQAIWMASSLP
ncbi:MAG: aldo/keto reductase [Acidobacteria bacterium]|nr:MAG: aldo/keto reductase [Acidobacteriota bacterium]